MTEDCGDKFHRKIADTNERAADAYADELSRTKDPAMREHLGKKARLHKEHAKVHRQKVAEFGIA